ncbi:hypothetical protein [Thalassobaculum sp.]|uniref:hypothetical protein n=1 Tax=Thalassobaculum sp. TaxID=2022740 RepID=UPI0032ED6B08
MPPDRRPLQNRVTPFGDIVAVPQRGTFTGNRGIIHDPTTRTLLSRRWTSKAWIICVCEFRGRRREVMARRSWTELFFLDEATALAAGHRPCFYCRRANARAFQAAWAAGNRCEPARAPAMDAALHGERVEHRAKRLHPLPGPAADLPDGTVVAAGAEAFLVTGRRTLRWTPDGYREASTAPVFDRLITPPSTVAALAAGYHPVLHPSAGLEAP